MMRTLKYNKHNSGRNIFFTAIGRKYNTRKKSVGAGDTDIIPVSTSQYNNIFNTTNVDTVDTSNLDNSVSIKSIPTFNTFDEYKQYFQDNKENYIYNISNVLNITKNNQYYNYIFDKVDNNIIYLISNIKEDNKLKTLEIKENYIPKLEYIKDKYIYANIKKEIDEFNKIGVNETKTNLNNKSSVKQTKPVKQTNKVFFNEYNNNEFIGIYNTNDKYVKINGEYDNTGNLVGDINYILMHDIEQPKIKESESTIGIHSEPIENPELYNIQNKYINIVKDIPKINKLNELKNIDADYNENTLFFIKNKEDKYDLLGIFDKKDKKTITFKTINNEPKELQVDLIDNIFYINLNNKNKYIQYILNEIKKNDNINKNVDKTDIKQNTQPTSNAINKESDAKKIVEQHKIDIETSPELTEENKREFNLINIIENKPMKKQTPLIPQDTNNIKQTKTIPTIDKTSTQKKVQQKQPQKQQVKQISIGTSPMSAIEIMKSKNEIEEQIKNEKDKLYKKLFKIILENSTDEKNKDELKNYNDKQKEQVVDSYYNKKDILKKATSIYKLNEEEKQLFTDKELEELGYEDEDNDEDELLMNIEFNPKIKSKYQPTNVKDEPTKRFAYVPKGKLDSFQVKHPQHRPWGQRIYHQPIQKNPKYDYINDLINEQSKYGNAHRQMRTRGILDNMIQYKIGNAHGRMHGYNILDDMLQSNHGISTSSYNPRGIGSTRYNPSPLPFYVSRPTKKKEGFFSKFKKLFTKKKKSRINVVKGT